MIFTENDITKIDFKYKNGEKIKRKHQIYHQNIIGVRKEGIKYAFSTLEIEEYNKCKNSISYFIEKYTNVKLRLYQKKYLELYEKNRFIIWICARQMGSSLIRCIIYLHYLLFNNDKNILIQQNKVALSIEFLDKVKHYYKELPFFLKVGVRTWNSKNIFFENGNRIFTENRTKEPPIYFQDKYGFSYNIDILDIDDMSLIPPNIINEFWKSITPSLTTNTDSKIVLSGRFNGCNNLFFDLVSKADREENPFKVMRTYWWENSSWNEEWKEKTIKMIGSLKDFRKEYELSPE